MLPGSGTITPACTVLAERVVCVSRYWYHNTCLFPDMMTVFIALDPCRQENGCLQVGLLSPRILVLLVLLWFQLMVVVCFFALVPALSPPNQLSPRILVLLVLPLMVVVFQPFFAWCLVPVPALSPSQPTLTSHLGAASAAVDGGGVFLLWFQPSPPPNQLSPSTLEFERGGGGRGGCWEGVSELSFYCCCW